MPVPQSALNRGVIARVTLHNARLAAGAPSDSAAYRLLPVMRAAAAAPDDMVLQRSGSGGGGGSGGSNGGGTFLSVQPCVDKAPGAPLLLDMTNGPPDTKQVSCRAAPVVNTCRIAGGSMHGGHAAGQRSQVAETNYLTPSNQQQHKNRAAHSTQPSTCPCFSKTRVGHQPAYRRLS